MPRRFECLMLALLVTATPQPVEAVNLFFMPGDAFFSASLSEEAAAALPEKGGTLTLKHHWLHDDMYFCGYTGFAKLEVREMPPEIVEGMRTLYRELRERGYWKEEKIVTRNGEQERGEANPFLLLVYDKSFDPTRHAFGLKYNESWAHPPEEALLDRGTSRHEPTKYEKFVPGEEAVIRDWKDAPTVAGLPVEIPKGVKWASAGSGEHPPATVDAAEVRFFVLPHDALEPLFQGNEHARFWEVTPDGFRRFEYQRIRADGDKTELIATDVPFDRPEMLKGF